jgi:DNA recombination protein RmuC
MITYLLLVLMAGCLAFLAAIWWRLSKKGAEQARLEEQSLLVEALRIEKAQLERDLAHERAASSEKLALLQQAEGRLKTEFENLANRIFESREQAGAELHRNRMTAVLEPFKQQLEAFRQRVEEVHRNDTEQAGRLIEQVRQLQNTE